MSWPAPTAVAKSMLVACAAAFAALWVVSPLAITALLVSISRTERSAWIAVAFEGAMILFTVAAWYTYVALYPDPLGPLTLIIFLPFAQYLAIVIFLFLVSLFGWRAKESWLKD